MAIYFYKEFGPLGYLANYANYGFYKDNKYWKTAEHYYQAQKFKNPEIKEKIRQAITPNIAAQIGRNRENPIIENWDEVRNYVMLEAVILKFKNNPDILKLLLETGDEEIIEATVKESYWGCGPCGDGKNMYGKILVLARYLFKMHYV